MTCALCSLPSSEGSNLCHWHIRRLVKDKKQQLPAAKKSVKQAARDRVYAAEAKIFKVEHPVCEIKGVGCEIVTADVHHEYSGSDRSKYYLDQSTWKAVCRSCHRKIHDEMSTEEAIELGVRKLNY